ncbi:MAG: gliding motility-associated C-terminal domain-containing protein [Saprospiraceae bacterium]|nr:gliding motility-associated C-terminal domain-containing protein [Saprospiraceae bacterium]
MFQPPLKIAAAIIFLLPAFVIIAQTPEWLDLDEAANQRSVCNAPMDAGTIGQFMPLGAQTTDFRNNPIFLCFGDNLFINHSGDFDLSGDPVPGTEPGIGYAFYFPCQPTVRGPEVINVLMDACLLDNPAPPSGGIWLARGQPNGDVVFTNNGNIQDTYFGGGPGRMWFAPITVTDFNALTFDDGSCVDVNVDAAFSVIYLNQIILVDFFAPDDNSLTGAISLAGGLPEWDMSNYIVSLVKIDDPSVTGTIDNAISHGGTTTFSVPEAGVYRLLVTDEKGCTKEFIVTIPSEDPVGLCLPDSVVRPGQILCVPVTVNNFQGILSLAMTISWDPNVIDFTNVSNINPILGASASFDVARGPEGILPILWFDLSITPQNLMDGDTLFELCFNVIGAPGSRTGLQFANEPTQIDITDEDAALPLQLKNGSITVTEPDDLQVFYSACANVAGTVDMFFQVYGGADPYTYDILDPFTVSIATGSGLSTGLTEDAIDLPPGTYTILVTDSRGQTATQELILDGTQIDIELSGIDPTCANSNDGVAKIDSVVGGSGRYRYTWVTDEGLIYGRDSLENLGGGSYTLIAEDENGCIASDSVMLVEDTLDVTFPNVTLPFCEGQTNGSIEASINSSSGSMFEYVWTNETGMEINRVTSGNSYTLPGLGPGKYFLTVNRDICTDVDSVELLPLKDLQFLMDTVANVTCAGATDGRIDLRVGVNQNKTAPYDFSWSANAQAQMVFISDTASQATMLPAGTYTLTVRDQSGCEIDTSFIIGEPDSLMLRPTVMMPACPDGADGSIDLFFNSHGGTPYMGNRADYDYLWWDGRTNSVTNDLSAGSYAVTITDANGCTDSTVVELRSGPDVDIFLDQDLQCIGDSIGQLTVLGDLGGNNIIWSTGETSETISNLGSGIYVVQVTEMMGDSSCTVSDTFALQEPDFNVTINLPMQFVPLSQCNEPDSGRIFNLDIDYNGPTSFIWHPLNDTTTIPFITVDSAGSYPFSVIDRITGCTIFEDSVNAAWPDKIVVMIDSSHISCQGQTDGAIDLTASGRMGQFTFDWSTGAMSGPGGTSGIQDLAPGTYMVTVTDASDPTCQVPLSIDIREPDALMLEIDSTFTRDVRCSGEQNGQIGLIWTGGNQDQAPTINWSHDPTNQGLLDDNLPAGDYTISLQDWRQCGDTISISLIEPGSVHAIIPIPQDPICSGFQTTVTVDSAFGGTGMNFTFSVDNGPTQVLSTEVPVFAGMHLITIFDEMGCKLDSLISITDPEAITVDLGEDTQVSLGDSVRLIPSVDSNTPIAGYIWTPENFLSCPSCNSPLASPLDDQVFVVTVVDVNGCTGSDDIVVRVDKARNIYIPNGFTPNNDGVNDKFQVYAGVGVQSINSTRIFDRWGNLVYEFGSEPPSAFGSDGWNGEFESKVLSPGVFVYLVEVEFIDGRVLLYRGDVTLAH